jgi:hypothetical protein
MQLHLHCINVILFPNFKQAALPSEFQAVNDWGWQLKWNQSGTMISIRCDEQDMTAQPARLQQWREERQKSEREVQAGTEQHTDCDITELECHLLRKGQPTLNARKLPCWAGRSNESRGRSRQRPWHQANAGGKRTDGRACRIGNFGNGEKEEGKGRKEKETK